MPVRGVTIEADLDFVESRGFEVIVGFATLPASGVGKPAGLEEMIQFLGRGLHRRVRLIERLDG